MKKLGLKVTGLLKMTSITQLLAILMAIGLVVGCPPTKTIGLTDPGPSDPGGCNCDCDMFDYLPVCGQGGHHQFFNPCYAGCQAKEPGPEGNFLNCTCVPALGGLGNMSDKVLYEEDSFATLGPCKTECVLLPVFLASFFMTMLVTFLANMH